MLLQLLVTLSFLFLRASSVYSDYFPTATLPGEIWLLFIIVQFGESVLRNCQFNRELKMIKVNLDIIKAKGPKIALKTIFTKDQQVKLILL